MKEWIIGRNPVYEVLRARRRQVFRLLLAEGVQKSDRLDEIMRLALDRKIAIERVPRQRLDSLGENPQGVALQASAFSYAAFADVIELAKKRGEDLFVLVLDLIQNPQNLGTLLRTAEAAGVQGVILPLRQAALVTPAVVSASSGASEHMLIVQSNLAQAISALKETGAWIVGLEGSPAARLPGEIGLDGPLALVVGNEGEGMRPLIRQSCDLLMRLPMRGQVDSLNAAVAGSIAIYLVLQARARAAKGTPA
ncbi:MAG TPA: 23S rRNA (guanosine(2251)-2'-O)-methyltransferase RlmB [Anaerolineaceae bacterium]|nr:23S rRNA (guanosine(2251)-2'-O)-methyltransferase RlmB [Anaerolineaceae bacterium]